MGCAGLVVAGLLALAVPASIAPASLVGAYVVIVILALFAAAALWSRSHRRAVARAHDGVELPVRSRPMMLLSVAVLALGYGVIVTVIHVST